MSGMPTGGGGDHEEIVGDDPLTNLEELVGRAEELVPVEIEDPGHDDPLQGIRALIDRARRESEGEGAKALRRLEDRIERAKWIPEPEPYRRPEGDPLEVLEARMRGEPVEDTPPDTGGPSAEDGDRGAGRRRAGAVVDEAGGRHRELGAALERSLRNRPLPGPVRAEVAGRLASLVEESDSEELRAIWELVVFEGGESGQ